MQVRPFLHGRPDVKLSPHCAQELPLVKKLALQTLVGPRGQLDGSLALQEQLPRMPHAWAFAGVLQMLRLPLGPLPAMSGTRHSLPPHATTSNPHCDEQAFLAMHLPVSPELEQKRRLQR